MKQVEFSKTRHELNNKIAILDASLSALRIYLQRFAEVGDDDVLRQKTLAQLREISGDMLTVSQQVQTLLATDLCP